MECVPCFAVEPIGSLGVSDTGKVMPCFRLPNQPPASLRKLIVDLVNGPFDGETLLADDDGYFISEKDWWRKERVLAIFRDTNDGDVGQSFSLENSEGFYPTRSKYPIYRKSSVAGRPHLVEWDTFAFSIHQYRITDRLASDDEVLVRAVMPHGIEHRTSIIHIEKLCL